MLRIRLQSRGLIPVSGSGRALVILQCRGRQQSHPMHYFGPVVRGIKHLRISDPIRDQREKPIVTKPLLRDT